MSHISRIRTEMTERNDVMSALKDLGVQFQQDIDVVAQFSGEATPQKRRANFAVFDRGRVAIHINKVGPTFEVHADWYEIRSTTKEKFLGQLTQRYAYHAQKRQLEAQGFELVSEARDGGAIRLLMTRRVLKQGPSLDQQEIESRIGTAGEVTMSVRGVKGRGCLDVSRDVERALGEVTSRELTLEGFFGDFEKREPDYVKVALIPPPEKAQLRRAAEL